jgi:hypothetical protein
MILPQPLFCRLFPFRKQDKARVVLAVYSQWNEKSGSELTAVRKASLQPFETFLK